MVENSLIYGKDDTQRVVGIEPNGDVCVVYTEDENGVHKSLVEHRHWLLSPIKIDGLFAKLEGQLFYKWGKQYTNKDEYLKERWLYKKHNIYSIYDDKEAFMVKDGYTYFKGMNPKEVSILSFDIETTGLYHNKDSRVLLISNTYRKGDKVIQKLFCYDDYENDKEFLLAWTAFIRECNPSVICGHNINNFDFPYIQYIADKNDTPLILGRDDSEIVFNKRESLLRVDGSRDLPYRRIHIHGREIIDTMFLSVKYDVATKKYESYGLKNIIKQEGLEEKDRQFYDASKIRVNYKNKEEWEKIKAYCNHDSLDSLKLFDLMVPAFFYMTQSIPKSFQSVIESASGSQINSILVRSYLQEGHSIPIASDIQEFQGAISEGNPGIYTNVFKKDISSLYPSIMLQYEVFDKQKDPKANFLNMLQYFTEQRLMHKRLFKETNDKYHDDMQSVGKTFINSGYGFMGARGLNFNSLKNAAFVTTKGREILNIAIDWAKNKDFTLVNCDTDSISICKKDQQEFSKEEQTILLNDLNSLYPSRIRFEHDGVFKKFIVLKAKNYIMYDGNKIKLKGSSLKSSTLEQSLKGFLNEMIDALIFDKTNYTEIYHKYVKEINDIKDIKRWCSKKTLSSTTYKSERTNETKIIDAIKDTEYVEGDKVYLFFKSDDTLCLAERFTGDYNKDKFYKKLYECTERFESILDVKNIFLNYALKRNKEKLTLVLNET